MTIIFIGCFTLYLYIESFEDIEQKDNNDNDELKH